MGPIKMSYPCTLCGYIGSSARQLSRHKAVTHVKNPLTCILCPFITAYQTNLLRHRREVHGILGSKGNKSCKFCGFEAQDNDTLILHQQEAHQDILKSARERFAREKKSARGTSSSGNSVCQDYNEDSRVSLNTEVDDENNQHENEKNEDEDIKEINGYDYDEDKDFWKEGFMDNPPNVLINLSEAVQGPEEDPQELNWSNNETPQENSPTSLSDYNSSRASTPVPVNKQSQMVSSGENLDTGLAPTRIRRQYTCHDCGIRTVNPREFLYHRRDVHSQKVKIVECPYCVYACQYFQKLQRHILLVHKMETSMTPPAEIVAATRNRGSSKTQSILQKSLSSSSKTAPHTNNTKENNYNLKKPSTTSVNPMKSSASHAASSKSESYLYSVVMSEVETGNIGANYCIVSDTSDGQNVQRKCFFCSTCGYRTNVQYLFRKHTKYHSAPKIKCDMCDFESPYSWNVERHARGHRSNGLHTCLKCSYSSDKPQAITIHMNQHHREHELMVDDGNVEDQSCSIKQEEEEVENQLLDGQQQHSTKNCDSEQEQVPNHEGSGKVPVNGQLSKKVVYLSSTSKSVTYVRKADGKIVAKPVVAKKCKYCVFQTDTFSKLQKHEVSAHPEKRYQCPFCEIRFENLIWLQRHVTHMHQEDDQANSIINVLDMLNPKKKRPASKTAQETYVSLVDNSRKINSGPQNNANENALTKCKTCGYQTRWISELQKHMRVHKKEKPFICPYCSFRSKWKGDLNRHIRKYHSRLPMPDLNAMEHCELRSTYENSASAATDQNDTTGNEDTQFDHLKSSCSTPVENNNSDESYENHDEDNYEASEKSFTCCYCDFTCVTASRFHAHFIQHLNSKPFMCSACGHKSRLDWDFNLVDLCDNDEHDVDREIRQTYECTEPLNEAIIESKRPKIALDENLDYQYDNMDEDAESDSAEAEDPESIVITPDILFPDFSKGKAKGPQPKDGNNVCQSASLQPNVPYTSEKSSEGNTKLFHCAYCEYAHRDSKALVSHLSVHAKKKPYKCGFCNFSSNWKEVVSRHASSRHNGSIRDVEQLFKYTVNKYICRILDHSGEVQIGPEIYRPTSENVQSSKKPSSSSTNATESCSNTESVQSSTRSSSANRISGFKGDFKCAICPFRAEKSFHMDFHTKRHQPLPGADYKCPYCPYWVNAKKSLNKHIYLHDYESEMALQEEKNEFNDLSFLDGLDDSANKNESGYLDLPSNPKISSPNHRNDWKSETAVEEKDWAEAVAQHIEN